MNPDENRTDLHTDGAPAPGRSFDEQAQRETESVFRRTEGESLDDYLRNVNAYISDLNRRLGVPQPEPEPEQAEESAPQPEAPEADVPEEDVPFARSAPYGGAYPGRPAPGEDPYFYQPAPAEDPYGYRAAPAEDAYYARQKAARNYPYPGEVQVPRFAPGVAPVTESAFPEAGVPPYGGFADAPYAEPLTPYDEPPAPNGTGGSNWQAAVPNPELYPDLDDPAVTDPRGARKKKRRQKKAAKKEKPVKTTSGGKSRFSFVTTLLNLGLYAGWTVLYFVSLSVRSVMFTSAQAEMASQGVVNYTLSISSPLFTVLKILMYAMPVVMLLWMKGVLSADKKDLPQVDRRLLIAAFAADLLAGGIALYDVMAGNLIFT